MLLAGLSTGHMIGMGIVAVLFVGFALVCSFVIPRRMPDFPGSKGIGVFAIACIALFAAQLASVLFFGVEKSEAKGAEPAGGAKGGAAHAISVTESEFKIALPPQKTLAPGSYTLTVKNSGKIPHDLAITGPKLSGTPTTPMIAPGATSKMTVSLETGMYQLYCTVPGHRKLGMAATISVG